MKDNVELNLRIIDMFNNLQVSSTIEYEMSLTFIHRTPYLGKGNIEPRLDPKVGQEVVWIQCGTRRQGCCKNYGPRSVPLQESDFAQWEIDDGFEGWRLYEMDGKRGRNPNHYFHNLVLVPYCDFNGYDDFGCDERGWDFLSEYDSCGDSGDGEEAFDWLQSSVEAFAEDVQDNTDYAVNHIHMAIVLPYNSVLHT